MDVLFNSAANDDRYDIGTLAADCAAGRGVILKLGSISWHRALAKLTGP